LQAGRVPRMNNTARGQDSATRIKPPRRPSSG
jgi:hypothetical protein